MMSECSYSWFVVSVCVTSVCCLRLSVTVPLYCAMINHFCVIVLFEYTCDMDHKYVVH